MTYPAPSETVTATEVVLPGLVEPAGHRARELALPAPAAGQALVRVEATGVSFAEIPIGESAVPAGGVDRTAGERGSGSQDVRTTRGRVS